MYRKKSRGWYKHKDFILIDLICLFLSLIFASAEFYAFLPKHICIIIRFYEIFNEVHLLIRHIEFQNVSFISIPNDAIVTTIFLQIHQVPFEG